MSSQSNPIYILYKMTILYGLQPPLGITDSQKICKRKLFICFENFVTSLALKYYKTEFQGQLFPSDLVYVIPV